MLSIWTGLKFCCGVNPLPHMPNFGSSNSTANKDMMSKIWTNGYTIILFSRKHCWKRRNCSLRAISSFPTVFKSCLLLMHQNEYLRSKGLKQSHRSFFLLTLYQMSKFYTGSNSKGFSEQTLILAQMERLSFNRTENIVGIAMLNTTIFSFCHIVFKKLLLWVIKTHDCAVKSYKKDRIIEKGLQYIEKYTLLSQQIHFDR